MITTEWFHDPAGNPALYMNVLATCRDHARFGYLFLHRGCWAGTRVVPEDWVAHATAPSTAQNPGYGWFWWRSGGEPTLDLVDASPLDRGTLHPGGPDDSFWAVGLGDEPSVCASVECDPLLQDCGAGLGCYPVEPMWACAPDNSAVEGQQGDSCESFGDCSPGRACVSVDAYPECDGPTGCCARICDLAAPVCSSQLDCVPWYAVGQARTGAARTGRHGRMSVMDSGSRSGTSSPDP